jgi:hypothetical protein
MAKKRGPAITGLHSQGISDIARQLAKAAAKKAMRQSASAAKTKAAKQVASKNATAAAKKKVQEEAYERMLERALKKSPTGSIGGSEIMDIGRRASHYYKK